MHVTPVLAAVIATGWFATGQGYQPCAEPVADEVAPVLQTDTVYATGWGFTGRVFDGSSVRYQRGRIPMVKFYYFAFHSLYQEERVHAYLFFPLDSNRTGTQLTSADLCYTQAGVTGIMKVGVCLVPDTAATDSALWFHTMSGPRLTGDSNPGPNGQYRRRLNERAAAALDSCRTQGWIAIGLVAGTHNRNGESEIINLVTNPPPFLELSWSSGLEESCIEHSPSTFRLYPSPATSQTPVRIEGAPATGWRVTVVDVTGRVVRSLAPGSNEVIHGLAAGVYAVRAVGPGLSITRRLVVLP